MHVEVRGVEIAARSKVLFISRPQRYLMASSITLRRVLLLWLVAVLLNMGGLADSFPTIEYDQNSTETKVTKKRSSNGKNLAPSSTSFFPLGNLLQRLMKTDGSASIETTVNEKPFLKSDYALRAAKNHELNKLPGSILHAITTNDSSEEDSPTEKAGNEFDPGTTMDGEDMPDKSEGSSFSLQPSSDASTRLPTTGEDDGINFQESSQPRAAVSKGGNGDLRSSFRRVYDGGLADIKSASQTQLDRRKMLIPATGKMTISSRGSSTEYGRGSDAGASSSSVLQKIGEYAAKASQIPTREKFVTIGDAHVPREKATLVGDVDGNQISDYIVTNVASKNYSGTVRLYLMTENNRFLYTRDLVPGKWGFEHSGLSPGDRYGTTVFRLPNTGKSSQCFIAITAPGDRTVNDKSRVVYVLELSKKGNVKKHTKLPARDFLELVERQYQEEHQNSTQKKGSEQISPSSQAHTFQHLDGVTSMVFFNSSGDVKAYINVKSSKDKDLLKSIDQHLQENKLIGSLPTVRIHRGLSQMIEEGTCLFNMTHCDCKLESSDRESGDCYEMFESKEEHGRLICLAKVCPASYACSCDGDQMCRRVVETQEIYIPKGNSTDGAFYCTAERRTVMSTAPLIS